MRTPTILTIEPNENILIREVMERVGYRVAEAGNIREVVEQLILDEPAVIILDCLLGGPGYGLDLLRELRTTPRTSHIPVVITTGVPEPDIDRRLRHCGASAFLQKPFGPRDLVHAVAIALALTPPKPEAAVREPTAHAVKASRGEACLTTPLGRSWNCAPRL